MSEGIWISKDRQHQNIDIDTGSHLGNGYIVLWTMFRVNRDYLQFFQSCGVEEIKYNIEAQEFCYKAWIEKNIGKHF